LKPGIAVLCTYKIRQTMQQVFIDDAGIGWEDLGGGLSRKIMAYDDRVMVVKVAFETGGVGLSTNIRIPRYRMCRKALSK
jgi:hypothetical protein